LMNVLALTPLLERFEAEHGTLTTFLLFVGRKCISLYGHVLYYAGKGLTILPAALSTIPALLYTLIERGILHMNTSVLGARYGLGLYNRRSITFLI
jgi:glycosylphosphatidylinositol transamidase